MNKKKYPDYSWVWLVVGGLAPAFNGLLLFIDTGDIKVLGISLVGSVVLFIIVAVLLYPSFFKRILRLGDRNNE